MKRIIRALVDTYNDLSQRKLLIIDDEADYASIGFRMNRNEGVIEINKIADRRLMKTIGKSLLNRLLSPYFHLFK